MKDAIVWALIIGFIAGASVVLAIGMKLGAILGFLQKLASKVQGK
jgi:hypothetical protein